MIESAANIDFNTFFIHMSGLVLAAWLAILVGMRFLFRAELAVTPDTTFTEKAEITNKRAGMHPSRY
jgi:Na+/H+ antiporter NhaD/arsenite permease-like protein